MTSSTTILSRCAVTAAVRKETQEVRTFVSVMKGHFTPHLPLARPVSAPQKEWHSSTQVQQPTGPTIPLVLPVALAVLDDATISTAQPAALPAVTSAPVAPPAATSAPVTQPSCIRDSCSCGPTSSRSGDVHSCRGPPAFWTTPGIPPPRWRNVRMHCAWSQATASKSLGWPSTSGAA